MAAKVKIAVGHDRIFEIIECMYTLELVIFGVLLILSVTTTARLFFACVDKVPDNSEDVFAFSVDETLVGFCLC